ncbi:hemolysin-type calcium-binding region protein [Planktothrix agardhii CCAP 1459/11A]|uniref:Hemolysin-type calcium-binding region protein n=1 Tax=Planktothrix agardhii CCAP 1459/11A TaxID=282420 RepID=A0A4P5ZBP0_PLAAG|nr:calcium-binding protein [Planktothrix agardhii]GDZ92903.1 hemolysin-type calcium-binding region protein [Planktothrix agardhii CCAP 1459/11A]
MPDNVALLEKNNDLLNGSSAESQEDCGCSFKKAPTQETVSNPQNVQSILNPGGNDTLESSVTQDLLNANTGNEFLPSSTANIRRSSSQVGIGSLSSDGSAYILTEGSDTFTIPLGLLDTLVGGLRGLGGADLITGSESADIVYGDEGDDRIEGLGGADLFYGGPGNDFLSGGAGQNGLLGGDGADTLQGGESADGVNGNRGDDVIFGGGGNDFLRGGRGNDIVNGEDGDDLVIGDFGNDTLTGGAGQDVFFLRYEAALGSPTFDLITDFQRTIDFIGLSTNLRESDVILESKVQPSGGSAVDIKVAATGTLLGTVLGVTPDDLKGRFRPYDVEGERPEDVATIDLPEVTKLSENRFQMEFPASDGSKYTIVFQDDADGRFVESVIFVPNPTTGVRGSTTLFNRDGTQADITLEGSNETVRVESRQNAENGNQEEGVISGIKDGQIIDTVTFPLPIEPTVPTNPEPPVTPPTVGQPDFAKACESVKKFCEGTGKVGKVVSFAADALAVTGLLAAPVSGGTSLLTIEPLALGLKIVSEALKVVKYSCILLTGSDSDLGSALIKDIGKDLIKGIAKSGELAGDVGKGTADTLSLVISGAGLIDSFQKKEPTASKTNFLPQIRKFLTKKYNFPFDFCDEPSTTPVTPEPPPTCLPGGGSIFEVEVIPDPIPYGQTAQYKITYCDPKGEIDNIHIELNAGSGTQTKDIPISSPSGTVSFGIRNKPNAFGDCYDLNRDTGLGLSVYSEARSGNSQLFGLGDFRNLLFAGDLPNAMGLSSYCDAELV